MDSDEEDFVFYGTPIEREEELSSRKKKAIAESSGHLRTLPAWKQEVVIPLLFALFLRNFCYTLIKLRGGTSTPISIPQFWMVGFSRNC